METQANEEKFLRELESEQVNTTLVKDIQKTPEYTRQLQELVSNKMKTEQVSMVKLNARCSAVLQNELPPNEKDPRSFVLPCIIGTTTVSNALTDLEANRSMKSPKGIVKNVLVKIHNFIFPVDFVILDIVEDNKIPIILGRPMLATAHARIDVFGSKNSLEVGKEQIIFNANEGATPVTISPVCLINNFDVIDNFGGPEDLEELIMDEDINRDLGSFLQNNNLLPGYKDLGAAPPSPNKTAIRDWNLDEEFQDPNDDFCIGIDNITTIDALWDNLDPGILTNKKLSKLEFLSIGNRVHRNHPYNLQIIFYREVNPRKSEKHHRTRSEFGF
ncbi:zinc knuckle CX2CX4HX4C containing protein [Tanacetum coccineum]